MSVSTRPIIWTKQARDQLRAIERDTALRILRALARFAASGDGDVKRLQGIEPPEFRLRVGDYRLRFHDLNGTLRVTAVKHRRDVYR